MLDEAAKDWDVPRSVIGCRYMIQAAARHGIDPQTSLTATGLSEEDLADCTSEIQALQELAIIRNIVAHSADPLVIAHDAGSQFNLADLGLLGYALLASPTVGDATASLCRFVRLTTAFCSLEWYRDGLAVVIEADDSAVPYDVRDFVQLRHATAVARLAPSLLAGVDWRDGERELSIRVDARNENVARAMSTLPGSAALAEMSCAYRIRLSEDLVAHPMPAADATTAARCVLRCQQLLEARYRRRGFAAMVRRRIRREPGLVPSIGDVASELNCGVRTLRRRLAAENTTFSALVEETREDMALSLLTAGLTVHEVARRLGYSDASAFTRAFTRWRGDSPRAFRQSQTG